MDHSRVLVAGGGVAGLTAARTLAAAGVEIDLIEASPRLGGRILMLHEAEWDVPIELGAEFVHGKPKPTVRVLADATLGLEELEDRHHWPAGGAAAELVELTDFWKRIFELLCRTTCDSPDRSAAAFLERSDLRDHERALFELFVRGYHAAPLAEVSLESLVREASGADNDEAQHRVSGGYGKLVKWLTERVVGSGRCRLHLESRLRRVIWRRGRVEVELQRQGARERLSGRALLLSLPVGVLQCAFDEGGVGFEPALGPKQAVLRAFGMSRVSKLIFRFREQFWDERAAPRLEFLHQPRAPFLTYWRQALPHGEQITAWAGDASVADFGSVEEAQQAALEGFCVLLGASPARASEALLGTHAHDFSQDPCARGAYSFVRPGGTRAHELLAEPIERTLFFAGEATDIELPASVAGAIQSGERAAREVLDS